ncbi:hypothetical protein [Virgibacillus salexigens]|uniref:hypothetical protein n=1 Tax=Virgibacillus salexigens TaxID=61016 RepID=UPI00308181C7
MNLKEELSKKTEAKAKKEAESLAGIMKSKLIESANKGYAGLKISLKEHERPEYMDPYLQYVRSRIFLAELSANLDEINVTYEQEPIQLNALGLVKTVGHTPYLHFRWGCEGDK